MPAFRMFLVVAAGTLMALFAGPLASPPAGAGTITSPPTVAATNWTSSSAAAGSGSNVLNDVSCTTSTFCVAVGSENLGGTGDTLIEQWGGTSWTVVPSVDAPATTGDSLRSVSCVGTTFCLAVGGSTTGPAVAETWNGTAWSFATAAVPAGNTSATLSSVSCVSATTCEVLGTAAVGGTSSIFGNQWNGTTLTANHRLHSDAHDEHPRAERNRHGLCHRQLVPRGRERRHPVQRGFVLQRTVERHGVDAARNASAVVRPGQPVEFGVVRRASRPVRRSARPTWPGLFPRT